MYKKISGVVIVFFVCAALTGCNIYSGLAPSDVNSVNDVDTLMAMGKQYMKKGGQANYQKAYDAFNKILGIDSKNSEAIEMLCSAYCYKEMDVISFLTDVIDDNLSSVADMASDLYKVSSFVRDKLGVIIDQKADGKIDYKDINVNLSFYIFNTIYSEFRLADLNGNGKIINDSGDIFTFDNGLKSVNNLGNGNFTNNVVQSLKTYNTMKGILQKFDTDFALTLRSDRYIQSGLNSDSVKKEFSNITVSLITMKNEMDGIISNITKTTNYTISPGTYLSNMGVTNVDVTQAISNLLSTKYASSQSGYSNFIYDSTSQLGGTNADGFVTLMVLTFPEYSTNVAQIYQGITDFFTPANMF